MVVEVICNNIINVACLEEMKISDPHIRTLCSIVPHNSCSFVHKLRESFGGGGVLIGVDNNFNIVESWEGIFTLTIRVKRITDWWGN